MYALVNKMYALANKMYALANKMYALVIVVVSNQTHFLKYQNKYVRT